MSLIQIEHLRKEYPDAIPLKDVNTEINQGEVISIIGSSGTGKSTLLRCMNRLETPTSGSIIINGNDICSANADLCELRRNMGMVFQSFNLFPHKMVAENIMMPQIDLLGISAKEAFDEAMIQLKKVGLEGKARSFPDELSGGQKQRVAIARALAMHPKVMLFDEPTSALDPTMVSEVLSVIRDLSGTGLTMMIVTHEMRLARYVSSRIFYMDDGIIYEEGTPEEIFENPQKERTRDFIFRIKNWERKILPGDVDMYELLGSLETFCHRQFMDIKSADRLRLIIEEMVTGVIAPALEKTPAGEDRYVVLMLSIGEEGMHMKLEVESCGLRDVFENADMISMKLINNMTRKITDTGTGKTVFEVL